MDRKGLSPVVASIILIAVTVAVSIAVAAWMGALSFDFMGSFGIGNSRSYLVSVPSYGNATHAHAWVDSKYGSQIINTWEPQPLPFSLRLETRYDTATLKVEYYEYIAVNDYTFQLKQLAYQEFTLNLTEAPRP